MGKKLVLSAVLCVLFNSCVFFRGTVYMSPDIDDYKHFTTLPLEASEDPFYFPRASYEWKIKLPDSFYDDEKQYKRFDDFLQDKTTAAFLVIYKDSIVYERYFQGYQPSTMIDAFSVAKSFVSAMVGIAIEDGYIKSINDPITKYLPYLNKKLDEVRIVDLLNMRTGMNAADAFKESPMTLPTLYYGNNLKEHIKTIKMKEEPNTRYEYQSAATQMLAMAVESASGKKFVDYFKERLWSKLDMEFDASWTVDSPKYEQIRAFCCLNSTALDFAKFARLYENGGKYNGIQVVPERWVKTSLTQTIPESKDEQGYCYNYQWRVIRDEKEFFAKGLFGQVLYVNKDKDVIIVRIGRKMGIPDWPKLFQDMLVGQEKFFSVKPGS